MFSVKLRNSIFQTLSIIDDEFSTIFGELRFLLMFNHEELNTIEINSIFDLYKYGLENSNIKNETEWVKKNSSYFSGNAFISDMWKKKFDDGDFSFDSLAIYLDLIKAYPTSSNLDFSLRNVEVTLRDDVIFNNVTIYKNICRSVLTDIINGKAR